jgi:hypothetical protein
MTRRAAIHPEPAPEPAMDPLTVEARDLARTEADRAQDDAPDPEDYR